MCVFGGGGGGAGGRAGGKGAGGGGGAGVLTCGRGQASPRKHGQTTDFAALVCVKMSSAFEIEAKRRQN